MTLEEPTLLAYDRDHIYMGRTIDPHCRASSWKSECANYLGSTLRQLANLGYVCYKDYIPMCRVWFCLVGANNTPKSTWDAPEAAFKMMVARAPNKLHSQSVEYCRSSNKSGDYRTSADVSMHNSADLEDKVDSILAIVLKDGRVRKHKSAHSHPSRWLRYNSTTKPLHGPPSNTYILSLSSRTVFFKR